MFHTIAAPLKYLCFFFLVSLVSLEAKVMVYAHYFGQPEFLKYQYLFFKKNLLDTYELVIFEDSKNSKVSEQIHNECVKYGLKYVHIPASLYPRFSSPSLECCIATQYIYDHYVVPSDDICLILDNDIFLLAPFSVEQYLGDHAFAYVPQFRGQTPPNRVTYMLPNFLMLHSSRLPEKQRLNFNLGVILGNATDAGGYTHFYLGDYAALGRQIPRFFLSELEPDASALETHYGDRYPLLFHSKPWGAHFFVQHDGFLHLRMGSNWSKHPDYVKITKELQCFFDALLSEEL